MRNCENCGNRKCVQEDKFNWCQNDCYSQWESKRKLEFRVWDIQEKKYYYNVGFSMIGIQVYRDSNVPEIILLDKGMALFIIEQYSGEKDENGKKIWEVIQQDEEDDNFEKCSICGAEKEKTGICEICDGRKMD